MRETETGKMLTDIQGFKGLKVCDSNSPADTLVQIPLDELQRLRTFEATCNVLQEENKTLQARIAALEARLANLELSRSS